VKALDTNVLVRYLVQDAPTQGRKAAAFLEGAATEGEQILVSNVVLCETVWVLDSAYGYDKEEIEDVIGKLMIAARCDVSFRGQGRRHHGLRGLSNSPCRLLRLPDRPAACVAGMRVYSDLRSVLAKGTDVPAFVRTRPGRPSCG
jgi:hypothetical protein